ncbi:MAG: CsbD family protein [Bryobacteraceae bacterium]
MNQDRIEGNWKQLKGQIQEKWGKLTNDDVDVLEGRREQLGGRLQERYGLVKEEAERQASEFWDSVERTTAPKR